MKTEIDVTNVIDTLRAAYMQTLNGLVEDYPLQAEKMAAAAGYTLAGFRDEMRESFAEIKNGCPPDRLHRLVTKVKGAASNES